LSRIVQWRPRALKDLDRASKTTKKHVFDAVERFASTGVGDIRRLQAITPPLFRLRVGDLRILLQLPDEQSLLVMRVLPRDKAYR
jgi:mRNA-degrading endonuclease RelE of RelBE toxin-antitoxin system